ncbi:MAG: DNA repair protein RadA [Candidatus Bipolaricaulota bacterium]|nr:DNA repair protein RadA [Candidatus Bipolaricaulota bacterium]MCS7275034.1 DNA repair protein RadA [Candidatus Bipolaricaulota bacterium]MDW8110362.1 DNA repair protein RadA [Candidatus Bipolaricaulota bacterium]MDW8328742.1 DNA repair protein RadA [Candidatus Bipolaricaulota bacterium]
MYRCRDCGYRALKWLGRCPQCGTWESLVEVSETLSARPTAVPQALADIPISDAQRVTTGIAEFDRVLGGGLVAGSVLLVGGEPGIGKSTLLFQVAAQFARLSAAPVLYVSGEEAPAQIKLRADRLRLDFPSPLLILHEQNLSAICEQIVQTKAALVVIDSIQTVFPEGLGESIGMPHQVGQAAFALNQIAKAQKIPIFLIGHITKSGDFAGPKAIEHLVDVALYLEGGRESDVRILRAVKNRYGSTEEIGVFQMRAEGLVEIANPSQFFIERHETVPPGSVIVPSLEGTRPILIEIQALVAPTNSSYPQRRAMGVDFNRVALLLAVIEKHLGAQISREDVYVNVAGGLSVRETATDLGIALALVSSFKNRAIEGRTVVVGELGLAGEVRRVKRLKERLTEAAKLGYERAVIPKGERLHELVELETIAVRNLREAVEALDL